MKIGYADRKLEKNCAVARRKWGAIIGEKVLLRLVQLAAFNTLAEVPHGPPQRCHLYKGKNIFSVDLTGNYRLLFIPVEPYDVEDGIGIVRQSVKAITIISVEDPH